MGVFDGEMAASPARNWAGICARLFIGGVAAADLRHDGTRAADLGARPLSSFAASKKASSLFTNTISVIHVFHGS